MAFALSNFVLVQNDAVMTPDIEFELLNRRHDGSYKVVLAHDAEGQSEYRVIRID